MVTVSVDNYRRMALEDAHIKRVRRFGKDLPKSNPIFIPLWLTFNFPDMRLPGGQRAHASKLAIPLHQLIVVM
jgi:hypothetical protein